MIPLLLVLACSPGSLAPLLDSGEGDSSGDSADGTPGFESAKACAECHPSQYAEWRQSMHAYAALSPFFDALTAKAYRDSGGSIGTFCTNCHTQQGTLAGEPGTTTAADRSELSREGVTCDVCHTATGHEGLVSNARLTRELGPIKRGSFDNSAAVVHEGVRDDFVTSSELCGTCHDVYIYPGPPIELAYTEYLQSPAYDEGIRCQDCHMGPEPGVVSEREWGPAAIVEGKTYQDRELSNHSFVGPDYSVLPDFPFPDDLEASLLAQELYLGKVQTLLENGVGIRDLSIVQQGGELEVEISLESLTNGHRVPTGFTPERQLWLEVVVEDKSGEVVFISGDLDEHENLRNSHSLLVEEGLVEEDPWLVNLQSVNEAHGGPFNEQGALPGDQGPFTHEVIFPFDATTVSRQSLLPGEVRNFPYRFDAEGQGPYSVTAALKYRNLPPYVLQLLAVEESVGVLKIFTIDTAEASTQ